MVVKDPDIQKLIRALEENSKAMKENTRILVTANQNLVEFYKVLKEEKDGRDDAKDLG